jgi:hypothetical protein
VSGWLEEGSVKADSPGGEKSRLTVQMWTLESISCCSTREPRRDYREVRKQESKADGHGDGGLLSHCRGQPRRSPGYDDIPEDPPSLCICIIISYLQRRWVGLWLLWLSTRSKFSAIQKQANGHHCSSEPDFAAALSEAPSPAYQVCIRPGFLSCNKTQNVN